LPALAGSAVPRRLLVPVRLAVPAVDAAAASLVSLSATAGTACCPATWRAALRAGASLKISSRQITTPMTSSTAASALTPIAR
jgi:hypothetical protein